MPHFPPPPPPVGHRCVSACHRTRHAYFGAKFHERRRLPLLVVVRPICPHPVVHKPADDRPNCLIRRTHALGGVLLLLAGQTLRPSAVWSVPFRRR